MTSRRAAGVLAAALLAGCEGAPAFDVQGVGEYAKEFAPDNVPVLAKQSKRGLTRAVYHYHGIQGPVALHAALIHQESRWRPDAESPVGAEGLAQFMPATADWLPEVTDLDRAAPMDPAWSIKAAPAYTRHLYDQFSDAATDCDRWAMTLSAYNGGAGWVRRDQGLAENPSKWWGSVELRSDRATWAFEENRGYPPSIIFGWQPGYLEAGFAGPRICRGELDEWR